MIKKLFRRFFISLFAIILLAVLSVASINLYIILYANKYIYKADQFIPHKDAVVVLGASVRRNGTMSLMLKDRVNTGLSLYQQDKVKKILVSGDHGKKYYDEVNVMRKYLLKQGVPGKDIFMDHAGFDTYDSMYRAKFVFKAQNIVISTQSFHLYRAVYIARKLGLNAIGVAADQNTYQSIKKATTREILARTKAFIEIEFLNSKPKYIGKTFPITGNGKATWK